MCERLVGGRIVAIDRSATAISRAEKRNAAHIAAGRAIHTAVNLGDTARVHLAVDCYANAATVQLRTATPAPLDGSTEKR
jgi:hypothetical protein